MMEFIGKNAEEVSDYLVENGISVLVAEVFEEYEVDGESFLELTEDDVGKLVTKLGTIKKIMRIQRSIKESMESIGDINFTPQKPDPVQEDRMIHNQSPFNSSTASTTYSQDSEDYDSTGPHESSSTTSSNASTASTVSIGSENQSGSFKIPSMWTPRIMACIRTKTLNPDNTQ